MEKAEGTLLCLPDISGFTEFMSDVDYELASKVIPTLLNKTIYANTIGLKVSEIEGDAVFFFKKGPLPSFDSLIDQSIHFYEDFYSGLTALKNEFSEHEKAHKIPEILGLKIILHYGANVGFAPIGNSIKLLGEEVIVAHKLLKNKIEEKEYVLMTSSLLDQYKDKESSDHIVWGNLEDGEAKFDHLEKVRYKYLPNPSNSML
ncbi:DUF2652 domain-containing protein [Flagellimonas crocea]|uniref:DUF2652 domain-containing protein n=1 Tax=Flagellimonas crocea TaxID=3067311 RepID=UPI00296FBF8E|nr:DUF2652 domain-containing protein [Muricauda sp. DH64]